MKELFIISGSLITVFGTFCIAIYRTINGNLNKKFEAIDKQHGDMYNKINNKANKADMDKKVDREVCHIHIDALKSDIGEIKIDIKEIKREVYRINGKREKI